MKVVLLALGLISIATMLIGFNIFFRKKAFPDSHVSHNKEMKKRGIVCAKKMDRIEQQKVKDEIRFKNLTIVND